MNSSPKKSANEQLRKNQNSHQRPSRSQSRSNHTQITVNETSHDSLKLNRGHQNRSQSRSKSNRRVTLSKPPPAESSLNTPGPSETGISEPSVGVNPPTTKFKRRTSVLAPQLNLDPKRFSISSSSKREIIGGSHYSRGLLVDAQLLTRGPGPENIKYLENVDHLFFRPCKKFPPEIKDFNPKEKRGVWNSAGRCVYYVGLTNTYFFARFRSGFQYDVVDYLGKPVLSSTGSQWNFGLKGLVSVNLGDGYLLGTMEQELFGSTYYIKDGQGRMVYTIQAPCYLPAVPFVVWCFNEEFEICMDDGISEIGKITRCSGEEFEDFVGDLGIEFEPKGDNRVKALLLGVFFLIEFQYFRRGGNGVSYFIAYLVIAFGIVVVLSNGFGFLPKINSPLIPKEVVPT